MTDVTTSSYDVRAINPATLETFCYSYTHLGRAIAEGISFHQRNKMIVSVREHKCIAPIGELPQCLTRELVALGQESLKSFPPKDINTVEEKFNDLYFAISAMRRNFDSVMLEYDMDDIIFKGYKETKVDA